MGSIHLSMMELERHGQRSFEEAFTVLAPDHEWVVEYTCIHTHSSINIILCHRRGANHHTFHKIVIPAGCSNLFRQSEIILIEFLEIGREWHIT